MKATMNYAWTRDFKIEDVIKVIQPNTHFGKMENIGKSMFFNVFQGTSPREPILG